MKKSLFMAALLLTRPLVATVGFNCPDAETITCRIFDNQSNTFVCSAESVNVLESANILGSLPFYGPLMDYSADVDFSKANWKLVLGEYSYGFPDCVYLDSASGTKMNFIYRPEDLRKITSQEHCEFSQNENKTHIQCR